MKRQIFFLVVIIINASCTSQKETVATRYKFDKSTLYYINIPSDFFYKGYATPGESESQYCYNDSSFLYITSFKNTPNYNNIRELGDSIFRLRFQDNELIIQLSKLTGNSNLKILPDTFELFGQTNGLYWKDVKLGQISVGYANVQKEKVPILNKSIESIRKSKRMNNN